jgi:hypothetical protein
MGGRERAPALPPFLVVNQAELYLLIVDLAEL